jgi:glycosyltransferase involved in cell wall biosynthesis
VASALPDIFSAAAGPRAAIFHDAVALTHPELTPPRTVARFPAYLQELAAFDGIAAVSETSRDSLVDYWRWLGLQNPPPVAAITLGVDSPPSPPPRPPQDVPVVLSVGTIEGRKNHVVLLEACERLWARGIRFKLLLIGSPQAQTGGAALIRIGELQKEGRALFHLGAADDTAREEAYSSSSFTVFPSLAEGFGLPVAESLARGLPCICSGRGAPGEMARGGGCMTVDVADPALLAAAIERLLSDCARRDALADEAKRRPVRTWTDYSRDVSAWIGALPRRAPSAGRPLAS